MCFIYIPLFVAQMVEIIFAARIQQHIILREGGIDARVHIFLSTCAQKIPSLVSKSESPMMWSLFPE